MKFTFKAIHVTDSEESPNPTELYVSLQTENETLDVLLKDISKFLTSCGYQFEGTLKFVGEK